MNLFDLASHHALVDYAHNPHSYEALGGLSVLAGERIGGGGTGDRREDFITLGKLSAESLTASSSKKMTIRGDAHAAQLLS